MKLNLFGAGPERTIRILGGGYDPKAGRAVLIVQDDEGHPGTMMFDVAEARATSEDLSRELPQVERIVPTINAPNMGGTVILKAAVSEATSTK